jgi:5-methylcytosine-specific restriction endonuclease McrA
MPGLLYAKPEPLARTRGRKRRTVAKQRKAVRVELFAQWDEQAAESMGLGDDRPCDGGCGRIATAMHHWRLRSLGGADEQDNAVALCAWCHADAHAKLVKFTRVDGRWTAARTR